MTMQHTTDIIADVSNTILTLLQTRINEDGIFIPAIPAREIALFSPASIIDNQPRLCLFLYQVVENQYMKNTPMERIEGAKLKYQPLVLDLHYILMPYDSGKNLNAGITGSTIEEHRLMGKAMQILYDNRNISKLHTWENQDIDIEIPIKLAYNPVSLDDLTKLWQSIHKNPYRPSVCYVASPVIIESGKKPKDTSFVVSVTKSYEENPIKKEE